MNKLQEAKFKYYNDKKSLPVDANRYIKELEKSNAEMIKTLTIRVVKELKNLGCFGDHCLECVVFYKCKFSLDKILIEKATGQKIEELI